MHRLLVKEGENGEPDVYQPGATPWFGLRLRCGNSLIGARRAVWTKEQLLKGEHAKNKGPAPRLLKPGEAEATTRSTTSWSSTRRWCRRTATS